MVWLQYITDTHKCHPWCGCVHADRHTYTYARMHCTNTSMHSCTHTHPFRYAHTHAHTYAHTHSQLLTHLRGVDFAGHSAFDLHRFFRVEVAHVLEHGHTYMELW